MRVLTAGAFDTGHIGHAIFLRQSKALGDELIVALSTDDYIRESKHKNPIFSYEERKDILLLLPYVDKVVPNDQDSLVPKIEQFKPQIVTIGSDWGDRYLNQIHVTRGWLAKQGVVLVYLPYTQEISTTIIYGRCHNENHVNAGG